MKTSNAVLLIIAILVIGCDKNEIDLYSELTDGFCIVANDKVILNHDDIEYYDFSTHLIYLKDNKSFVNDIQGVGDFSVYANGIEVYSGQTLAGYSSFMPSGPIIPTHPSFYGDYIIPIGFVQIIDTLGNSISDPRGDERVIESLKKYNQFHTGLRCEIESVKYSSSTNVVIELQLINTDSYNYYYLDPEKMGIDLFHYFTNGLFISESSTNISYKHQAESAKPEPWNSWKIEWLSVIKSNEMKTIRISYDNFEKVPSGEFEAIFGFPGLSFQVKKEEIQQNEGRIWIGNLHTLKNIIIE